MTRIPPPSGVDSNALKAMGFAGLSSLVTDESELVFNPVPKVKVAIKAPPNPLPHIPIPRATVSVPTQPSGNFSTGWIWAIIISCIVILVAAVNSANETSVPPTQPAAATTTSEFVVLPQPAATVEGPKVVIAALTANIREKPSAQSRLIRSFKRGERLEFVEVVEGFTQVRLPDKSLAFVASELIVPEGDFLRLNGMMPQQYLESRASEKRIESLFEQIKPLSSNLQDLLYRISNRDPLLSDKLKQVGTTQAVQITADEAAGIWFALSARAAANSGQFDDARLNARAAVEANPMNPDYHVAFALSNYSQGLTESIPVSARILVSIAPRITNTWMVFGLAQAMDENDNKSDSLATGSFILAIKLSRNPDATRKYFKDLMTKSENPRVQQLLRDAMVEEAANPTVFGF